MISLTYFKIGYYIQRNKEIFKKRISPWSALWRVLYEYYDKSYDMCEVIIKREEEKGYTRMLNTKKLTYNEYTMNIRGDYIL